MCLWMSYMWSEAKTWHLLAGNPVDSSLSILLPPTLYIPSQLLRKCSVWLSWHDWQIMTCSSRCTFRDHTSWSRRRDKAAANLLLVTCQKLQQQRNGVAGYDLFTHNGHFWMNCFFFLIVFSIVLQWPSLHGRSGEQLNPRGGRNWRVQQEEPSSTTRLCRAAPVWSSPRNWSRAFREDTWGTEASMTLDIS